MLKTWSILIPTTPNRSEVLNRLVTELQKQIDEINAEPFIRIDILEDDFELSIGEKRNILVQRTESDYLSFFDSDDMPSANYIKLMFYSIQHEPDCVGIRGLVTWSGKNPTIFEHSLKHTLFVRRSDGVLIKPVAHLNPIKTSIAKQIMFPLINYTEDSAWSKRLIDSGLLKNEIMIDSEPVYLYLFDEPNSDSVKHRHKF
jgi:ribosomal protein S24E